MSKPRDIYGNDLIVAATAFAMVFAKHEGKENDLDYIKRLSFRLYGDELKRIREQEC